MRRPGPTLALSGATIHLGQRSIPTAHGTFNAHFFRDLARARTSMALAFGDLSGPRPLLTRVHSSCITSESLGACDCDCAQQLDAALQAIARAGRGLLFYLIQEGRGAGLAAKARDRMIVQASRNRLTTFEAYSEMGLPADLRSYHEVASVARLLGIRAPLRLLTNNPEKAEAVAAALAEDKLEVCGTRAIQGADSPFNSHYLEAKERSGHFLGGISRPSAALPPEPVRIEEPTAALDAPHLISVARYWLPISLAPVCVVDRGPVGGPGPPEVDWLVLRVVFDRRSGRESILLSQPGRALDPGASGGEGAGFEILGMLDRLPTRAARGRRALRQRLGGLREGGAGPLLVDIDETGRDVARLPGAERRLRRVIAEEVLAARWPSPGMGRRGRDDAG